jgi:ligand-binding SRPBCC domain-containing protein
MITMRLTTWVNAPMELCFRLATNVKFNSATASRGEPAGDTFQVGDTFDRSAWRMGFHMSITNRIEEIHPYSYFKEVMVDGSFRQFEHEHHFTPINEGTRVRSEVWFSVGRGPAALLVERVLLRRYVMKLLTERHKRLKHGVESSEWRRYLEDGQESVPESRSPKIAKMQRFA